MTTSSLPRFSVLPESQLNHESTQSLLIALLRGAAAIQVAAAHLRSEFYPGLRTLADPPLWYQLLAFLTGFAHQAVVVFFLISGWLVGGSLLNKFGKPDALKLYAIDRLTRLWTVLVPTFLLVLAIGIVGDSVDPRLPDASSANEFSLLVFAGNLLGLQSILLPEYGGNYPLWSLANETWYYIMFPLALLCAAGAGWRVRIWSGVLLVATAFLLPLPVLLYFSLWVLGAGFSRVRIDCGPALKALLLALLLVLSVTFRLTGYNDEQTTDSFFQDLLISLPLLLLLSASHRRVDYGKAGMRRLQRLGGVLSEFSFTLYVVHIPLLMLLRHAMQAYLGQDGIPAQKLAHLGAYLAILAAMLVSAYGFYLLFEARTAAIRTVVKGLLLGATRSARRPA
jgi:peptidoglycan/LPS O-acetylase OafA/YrhL